MSSRAPGAPPSSGLETALIAGGGLVLGAGFATWLGARLAVALGGGHVGGGIDLWLQVAARLMRGERPSDAWGVAADLPSASLYWACTAVVGLAFIASVAAAGLVWRRSARTGRRRRFGQAVDAHEATLDDVGPLLVDDIVPPSGRMLLGRMNGRRGAILATEDRGRYPLKGRAARRQGNRGSVALIGPTGSGKTALVAAAIATWKGPIVAVSVKRDLFDITSPVRAKQGEVAIFDPGGATGLPTARWSPLEAVTTSSGALRVGRAIAQAIPRSGVTNAEYWAKHGEKLLGAFMAVAGLARRLPVDDSNKRVQVSMEQLASWVTTMAGRSNPTINNLVRRGLDKSQPRETRLMARHASVTFIGVAKEDPKVRSSVYSTASLALDPWLEPSVAHSATDDPGFDYTGEHAWTKRPRFVDLDWLMEGDDEHANTLYLTASQPEFERLSPVLGGLLADIKDSIHAWDIKGKKLRKPLLFVIDEAGQLELGWLPAEVSTIAALGTFFVTCWQSLAQMQHRYTTLADAVLSGHRTKCFFAGIDDLATTKYLSGLLGAEHTTRYTSSRDVPNMFGNGNGRRSVSETVQREEFAPANTVREMYPGEAVLLHGTLPPIHLAAIRWWEERRIAKLMPPTTDDDSPRSTVTTTCPLTNVPIQKQDSAEDHTFRELQQELAGEDGEGVRRSDGAGGQSGPTSTPNEADARPIRGVCACCGKELAEGEATLETSPGGLQLRCRTQCSSAGRNRS